MADAQAMSSKPKYERIVLEQSGREFLRDVQKEEEKASAEIRALSLVAQAFSKRKAVNFQVYPANEKWNVPYAILTIVGEHPVNWRVFYSESNNMIYCTPESASGGTGTSYYQKLEDLTKVPDRSWADNLITGCAKVEAQKSRPYYQEVWNDPFYQKQIEETQDLLKSYPQASLREINENGVRHAIVYKGKDGAEHIFHIKTDNFLSKDAKELDLVYAPGSAGSERFSSTYSVSGAYHMELFLKGLPKWEEHFLRAQHDFEEAKADLAQVASFDLPRNRPVGYLGFSGMGDAENKRMWSETLKQDHVLPQLMSACGYQMVCRDKTKVVEELREEPEKLIEKRVKELYDSGVRDFFLNFNMHGDYLDMVCHWDTATEKDKTSTLSPQKLQAIFEKYKDCKFTVNSHACHGGGLAPMMREFRDFPGAPEGRVTVFVHTKEDSVNKPNGLGYQRTFLLQLAQRIRGDKGAPANYGESHMRADAAVRRVEHQGSEWLHNDPECWRSRPGKPSIKTSQLDGAKPVTDALAKSVEQYFAGDTGIALSHTIGSHASPHGLPSWGVPKGRC